MAMDIGTLKISEAISKDVVNEHKKIRWLVISLIVIAGVTGVRSSNDEESKNKKMFELMNKQAKAMELIANKITK